MCGIAAIVKNKNFNLSTEAFNRFTDVMAHRGPDGRGVSFFNKESQWENTDKNDYQVALGHRRLSILDLSEAGAQPMAYANGDLEIVFNGEIYNYVELKVELEQLGLNFRTGTDTEVILGAYKAWGNIAFEKLRGMWNIVIFDKLNHKIVACRDRLGIKPMFFFKTEGLIGLASEIKQFKELPFFNSKPNYTTLKEYLYSGFEWTDSTFFEEVQPILPGHFCEINCENLEMTTPKAYWEPESIGIEINSKERAGEDFEKLFYDSVKVHLRSDVPVGCQLSGGLDSSSVAIAMDQILNGESTIHTFTSTFPGYEKDEREYVDEVLKAITATGHFRTPAPDEFKDNLKKFIWHHDEPVGSFSQYANYELSRLINQTGIKVVLNGQGGDEVLGGYWQMYMSFLAGKAKQLDIGSLVSHLGGAFGSKGNEALLAQIKPMLQRYMHRKNAGQELSFTHSQLNHSSRRTYMDQYFNYNAQERRVFDIRYLILPRLLKWDDRNLMAFSVEGRYPLLDHVLIEQCLKFSPAVMYHKGWTKYPIRLGMKGKLPEKIQYRKSKFGFETPQERWLKKELRPFIEGEMSQDRPIYSIIDRNTFKGRLDEFLNKGKMEDGQMLLRLLLVDQWAEVMNVNFDND